MDRDNKPRKINDAIRQGLAGCRHSVAPLVSLAQFVDDLHANARWSEAEILIVEAAVRRMLARIVVTQYTV